MKLDLNGTEISYYDSGKGSPLVFLHSFGHTKVMWYPQLDYFVSRGFRVIASDYRGHGESGLDPKERYTIDLLAEDVATLLARLQLEEKATIVGISMGGYVALSLWKNYPELVSRLVLSNTKAESDTDEIRARRGSQIQYLKEHTVAEFVEMSAARRLSPTTLEQKPWVLDFVKMLNRSLKTKILIATLQAMIDKPDNTHLLGSVSVPTLITAGSDDIHIPKESAVSLNRGIKGSKFTFIDGTAHVSNLENSFQYNSVVDEFLTSKNKTSN
jgi:3-oxoadipate enol-lactonase